MIKPVTFQGVFNFKANLYALEVKSRFFDQKKADGYYLGYGEDLAAKVVGSSIQIGTGAFLVQGRMNEVATAETVSVQQQLFDGFVGYIVARIETYHPSDEENCTFVAYVNRTFEAIQLVQNDVYAPAADNENRVYELPIYSFKIVGNQITELTRLIKPIDYYSNIKEIAQKALATAENAVNIANGANEAAGAAVETAETAAGTANEAAERVERVLEQIGKKHGTVVTLGGEAQATFAADSLLDEKDEITFYGGGA